MGFDTVLLAESRIWRLLADQDLSKAAQQLSNRTIDDLVLDPRRKPILAFPKTTARLPSVQGRVRRKLERFKTQYWVPK